MQDSREFRELLIADLAVVRGATAASDVAAALQRFWGGQRGPVQTSCGTRSC